MKTFRILRKGYNKDYGYVFGDTIHIAVSRAKMLLPWVKHENLKEIKYK